jgi:hypothetical protein
MEFVGHETSFAIPNRYWDYVHNRAYRAITERALPQSD